MTGAAGTDRGLVRMTVAGLGVDSDSGTPVLVLEGPEGESLAMAIGLAEATSIAKGLGQLETPRPLSHDLLSQVITAMGARLRRVEVIDLRDDTYFAELVLERPAGTQARIDCRPSDAIALALRVDVPIFVHEHVLPQGPPEPKEFPSPTDKEGWKKLLDEMEPKDFGKYKM